MDFGRDNYQDFFETLHSSDGPRNLRQIFEDDDKPLQNESSNLRYQPQSSNKQSQKHKPKLKPAASRNKHETMTVESWNTVVAKVAQGYNGSDNVGRVGVALSRNGAGAAKLVVYKSRTQLLSTLLLTKSTQSPIPRTGPTNVILRESYMQFYDDEQRFWSLRFELLKDEEEFTDALIKLGLPIEQMRTEQSAKPSTTDVPPTSTTLPQPLPRHQLTVAAAAAAASATETAAVPTAYDSGSESTQSTEDVLTTSGARYALNSALSPVAQTSSALSVAITPQNISSKGQSSKLEVYLDQQRATENAMDKKMDTLLQAMCRLASCNNASLNEGGDSAAVSAEQQDINKMDNILKAMGRLAGANNVHQLNDSMDTIRGVTDNEDELLELEQKLLDFKKENRALMKSLRAKEQALADLRASTCALCEELLTQNNELKLQNTALISAMSSQSKITATSSPAAQSEASCGNCEQYLTKINGLERRLSALQSALLNCTTSGTVVTATTTNATAGALSPP